MEKSKLILVKKELEHLEDCIIQSQDEMMRTNQKLISYSRFFDVQFDRNHKYSDVANMKMISRRMDTFEDNIPIMQRMEVIKGKIQAYQSVYDDMEKLYKKLKKK